MAFGSRPGTQKPPFVSADANTPRDIAFNAKASRGKGKKSFGKKAPVQKGLTAPRGFGGGGR